MPNLTLKSWGTLHDWRQDLRSDSLMHFALWCIACFTVPEKELTLGLEVAAFSWSSLLLTSNPSGDLFVEER
jgi:hypothetical protein